MESEAGHYTLFIDLAETYIDKEKMRKRWKEWMERETGIMKNLEISGDRMHGSPLLEIVKLFAEIQMRECFLKCFCFFVKRF